VESDLTLASPPPVGRRLSPTGKRPRGKTSPIANITCGLIALHGPPDNTGQIQVDFARKLLNPVCRSGIPPVLSVAAVNLAEVPPQPGMAAPRFQERRRNSWVGRKSRCRAPPSRDLRAARLHLIVAPERDGAHGRRRATALVRERRGESGDFRGGGRPARGRMLRRQAGGGQRDDFPGNPQKELRRSEVEGRQSRAVVLGLPSAVALVNGAGSAAGRDDRQYQIRRALAVDKDAAGRDLRMLAGTLGLARIRVDVEMREVAAGEVEAEPMATVE